MIAAKVANALALDYPRDRLEVIVACDGSPDDTPAARARGGRRRRARAAARRQGPRPGRRGRAPTRAASVLAFSRRERALGARTRCARSSRAVRRPARRLRLRPGALRQRADGDQPGGPLLALRDGDARARVAGWPSVTAGNGAIYAVRREAYLGSTRSWATTSRSRSTWSSAAGARVYAPAARATEKMVPVDRGRVRAQAADDEPRLADRPARRAARPARLPAALRAR